MTIKQLEALYWAARLGSFALAAERLCMTQSSLSKRILELEHELNQTLFDRSGARARITNAGERVLQQAQNMLNLRDAILADAQGNHGLAGTCRFGVSELVASTWLASLVAELQAIYPQVVLEPRVGVTQEMLAEVHRGETDMAIAPGGSAHSDIASCRLYEVPMIWACAPNFPFTGGVLTYEVVQQLPVVSTSAQSGATAALESWAVARGLKFKRIIACNSMGAVAALAAAGLGLCLLPKPFAQIFMERGRLRALIAEPALQVPPLTYFLHWRKDDASVLAQSIRDVVFRVGKNLLGSELA